MTQIDIKLSEEIQEQLAMPLCVDVRLPKPETLELTLPTGGTIKGIADFTNKLPTDCSMGFSILAQIGPIMASMECLLKVLKLITPLVDVIKALPSLDVMKLGTAVPKFVDAAADLIKTCVPIVVGGGPNLLQFIKDLLTLIVKLMKCLIEQLESIANILGPLQLKIQSAQDSGNAELAELLGCAKENAMLATEGALTSIEPIIVILELAKPFFELSPSPPGTIQFPSLAAPEDLESLQTTIGTLKGIVDTLDTIVSALP